MYWWWKHIAYWELEMNIVNYYTEFIQLSSLHIQLCISIEDCSKNKEWLIERE